MKATKDKCPNSDESTEPRKSKVLWNGNFLDGKIIIAVDSKWDLNADVNDIYFSLCSYDYEFEGILTVKIKHLDWLNELMVRIGELYTADILKTRDQDNETLH